MPMQIPNAGAYDPRNIIGNANAQGIGTLYNAQAEQQQAALESIKQGMDQLKLDEAQRDLPKTAAQRQLDMSDIGNKQSMYDNGTERNLLQTTKDTAIGTQQATQTTNQKTMRDNRADVVIQANEEYQQHKKQNGGMGSQDYWNQHIIPQLQAAGIHGFDGGNTPQNEQVLGNAAAAATESQKQRQSMQAVTAEIGSKERISAAQIYSAEKIKQMEIASADKGTDHQVGMAMSRLLAGQGTPADKAVVDNWFAAKTASSYANQNKNLAYNLAEVKKTAAQLEYDQAKDKKDTERMEKAAKDIDRWDGEMQKAAKGANPVAGGAGVPIAPAAAPAAKATTPTKTLTADEAKARLGAKYNPAKQYGIDANGNLLQSK